MSTEDRLRAALRAQAEQLTDERLDRLSARREAQGDESPMDLSRGEPTVVLPLEMTTRRSHHPRRRWLAPVLAAAVVATLTVGVAELVDLRGRGGHAPISALSQHPSPPTSATASTPSGPTGSATPDQPPSQASHGGYLARGLTGDRASIPWSLVDSGWRLIRPTASTGIPQPTLYLYDPAGGRYLITDQLPPQTRVAGWSADAAHAALQQMDSSGIQLIDLHSGQLGVKIARAEFAAFTRPKGTALLAFVNSQLIRFGLDGQQQQTYSNTMNGIGLLSSPTLYLPDGSSFVAETTTRPVLIGNNGAPQAVYPVPAGYNICYPVKLWDSHTLLENCQTTQPSFSLFLQDLTPSSQPNSSTPPTLLVDGAVGQLMNAWPLTNGDTLLQVYATCQQNPYLIQHADGSLSPLRLPAGVSLPTEIANMNGNLATFVTNKPGCSPAGDSSLIDYNMVTGLTEKLLPSPAEIQDLPDF